MHAPVLPPRLSLTGITKRYGAMLANNDITLNVAPGEIHALLGENGAGKSTLMKIVYGVVAPDAGEIAWEGRPVAIADPNAARDACTSVDASCTTAAIRAPNAVRTYVDTPPESG